MNYNKLHYKGDKIRFSIYQVLTKNFYKIYYKNYLNCKTYFRSIKHKYCYRESFDRTLRPRVVITGADTITGLITARSLRGMNLSICGLVLNLNAPACKSRYWNRLFEVGSNGYYEDLIKIGRQNLTKTGNKSILLVSQDEIVIIVSERRSVIEKYYNINFPDKESVNLMMDKTSFHTWGKENEFSVPKSNIVENYEDIHTVQNEYKSPFILKPFVRNSTWDRKYPNQKFFYIKYPDELAKIIEDGTLFDYSSKYLIQEWVPGEDSDVYFCLFLFDENGLEIDSILGRKIYQWPLLGGSTAICIEYNNHELLKLSRRIMRCVKAKGLCSIEFKQHKDTGEYFITEPTVGRNDLQSFIGTAVGANLSRRYVEYLLCKPRMIIQPKRKAIWLDEIAVLRVLKSKKAPYSSLAICKLIFGRRRSYAYLDFHDPYPFWCLIRNIIFK